jgi:hypothetical protein
MSTRSAIILKVRKEDLGRTFRFDKELLSIPLKNWKNEWCDESCIEKSKDVTISCEYIGIYCHWDGDLDGVGAALKANFTDYDSILNLIIGGDCSYVSVDSVKHYANRKGEEWEYIKPKQGFTSESVADSIGHNGCVYIYDDGWNFNGKKI